MHSSVQVLIWPTPWAIKTCHELLFISLPNVDRFWKFFHWHTPQKTCNGVIIKYPITPYFRRYTTFWNTIARKTKNNTESRGRGYRPLFGEEGGDGTGQYFALIKDIFEYVLGPLHEVPDLVARRRTINTPNHLLLYFLAEYVLNTHTTAALRWQRLDSMISTNKLND